MAGLVAGTSGRTLRGLAAVGGLTCALIAPPAASGHAPDIQAGPIQPTGSSVVLPRARPTHTDVKSVPMPPSSRRGEPSPGSDGDGRTFACDVELVLYSDNGFFGPRITTVSNPAEDSNITGGGDGLCNATDTATAASTTIPVTLTFEDGHASNGTCLTDPVGNFNGFLVAVDSAGETQFSIPYKGSIVDGNPVRVFQTVDEVEQRPLEGTIAWGCSGEFHGDDTLMVSGRVVVGPTEYEAPLVDSPVEPCDLLACPDVTADACDVGPPCSADIETTNCDNPYTCNVRALASSVRKPECVDNNSQTYGILVLYAHPKGKPSRFSAVAAYMRGVLGQANARLYEAALDSSANTRTARMRAVCTTKGEIRLSTFKAPFKELQYTKGALHRELTQAARAAGFTNPRRKYLILWDGLGSKAVKCGSNRLCYTAGNGDLYRDDTGAETNLSNGNAEAEYASVYGKAWDPDSVLHELGHTMGAVQSSAPHATARGHCNDGLDYMCYNDKSRDSRYSRSKCRHTTFDCNFNDYFNIAPASTNYLATKWNIGAAYNRFIMIRNR